ncbi:MAG: hypothetical protein RL766_1984 [Bacteroidota bacterium]
MNPINLIKSPGLQKILLAGTLVLLVWMIWSNNQNLREENQRLEGNVRSLSIGLKQIQLENGAIAGQSEVLTLRIQELKTLFPLQFKAILEAGVKPERAQQVSTTIIETQKQIVTTIRDSLIHDTIRVKVFSYSDPWYTIQGQALGDTQRVQIQSRDSLIQVVFKGERTKPWLWIFSPRRIQQRMFSSNPNSIIKYSQTINIQKHE